MCHGDRLLNLFLRNLDQQALPNGIGARNGRCPLRDALASQDRGDGLGCHLRRHHGRFGLVYSTYRWKEWMSFAVILPFLRPIEPLIRDPEVSDIMVNGEGAVFFEKNGHIERAMGVTIMERSLQVAARNIARALGD